MLAMLFAAAKETLQVFANAPQWRLVHRLTELTLPFRNLTYWPVQNQLGF